jgi:hypothetical protein
MQPPRHWFRLTVPWIALLAAVLALGPAPTPIQAAASTLTTHTTIPFADLVNGCTEDIQGSGQVKIVSHVTIDGRGGLHMVTTIHPDGVTGVGLRTGTRYHGTGVTRFNTNGTTAPTENTFVSRFKFIGQGSGHNNLTIAQTIHQTVNANGAVTANVRHTAVTCRG